MTQNARENGLDVYGHDFSKIAIKLMEDCDCFTHFISHCVLNDLCRLVHLFADPKLTCFWLKLKRLDYVCFSDDLWAKLALCFNDSKCFRYENLRTLDSTESFTRNWRHLNLCDDVVIVDCSGLNPTDLRRGSRNGKWILTAFIFMKELLCSLIHGSAHRNEFESSVVCYCLSAFSDDIILRIFEESSHLIVCGCCV
jgi:hypothetical protein